jgi:hypothetical protein
MVFFFCLFFSFAGPFTKKRKLKKGPSGAALTELGRFVLHKKTVVRYNFRCAMTTEARRIADTGSDSDITRPSERDLLAPSVPPQRFRKEFRLPISVYNIARAHRERNSKST